MPKPAARTLPRHRTFPTATRRSLMDRLPVYFETREVGWITAADEASGFTYAESWRGLTGAFPVSLTMPLSRASYDASVILPWAANLLPENATLGTVGHMLGKSPADVIGLLAEMGRDTAGALSVGQPGTGLIAGKWREIPDKASLERILNELPHKPFLVGEDGVSMSLAGVQTKLAVALDGDTLYIPIDGAPSTHIIKPDGERLPGAVQNEAFCLTLARMIGIPTPKVTTGTAGERTYLLVERYDRRHEGKRWRRLHQEDFCQALGRPPAAKYQNNDRGLKGPSLADMVGVTQRHMTAQETARFVDLAIFNPMVWNTDSHAKNYSLMLSARGAAMAPGYDIVCAAPYPKITRNMAQKIGGQKQADQLGRNHWERFATDCKLSPAQTIRRVSEIAQAVTQHAMAAKAAVEAMPAGGDPVLDTVVEAVISRARGYLERLKQAEPAPEGAAAPSP
ncbi:MULTISPECIES: type II toxin-antitoxin system HipA family toxin [unclassified Bradyrhizobium]|nr:MULTISPECIES: type II toxin-antitoxin system HipA family toxin [unclassified Bradyrhizobium]MCA1429193.1 type II toxin-antitoxin system HipA family toxin [Bradyrhizobium sp. NBAIM16]MCA1507826.1 type II toxin-antitoxin system HipA family toxin [Bradyrhizobium sp. NBAIM02]